jgi:NADH-quinone oxidoreductase subunit J
VLPFQASGLILLVAMIGAIVLTLRDKTSSRHQNISHQLARKSAETMVFVEVATGAGVKETGILRPPEPEPEPAVAAHGEHGGH